MKGELMMGFNRRLKNWSELRWTPFASKVNVFQVGRRVSQVAIKCVISGSVLASGFRDQMM